MPRAHREWSQVSRRALGEQHKRIPVSKQEISYIKAHLKCVFAHSTGNKQEELEMCTNLQGSDVTGITEMWWEGCDDWSAGMDGCRLFRKDRQGSWGGGVCDQLECMELHMGMGEEPRQSLWIGIKGRAGRGDFVVGGLLQATCPGRVKECLYR